MSRSSTSDSELDSNSLGTGPDPSGTGDRVVASSPRILATRSRRVVAVLTMIWVGLLVVGSMLVDLFAPLPAPELFGAEAQREAAKREDASFGDGTLADLIEEDWRKVSRVRRNVLTLYVPFLYRSLGEVRPHLVAGTEGFLFLKNRLGVGKDRDAGLGRSAGWLSALSRAFRRVGRRLVVAPVPRKAVVMESRLPRGVDPRSGFDEAVVPTLRAARVDTVDLLAAMRSHEGSVVFGEANSHWSPVGTFVAARAVAEALVGQAGVKDVEVREVTGDRTHTLAAVLGLESAAKRWLPRSEEVVMALVDPGQARVVTQPPDEVSPVLLAGTSFSRNAIGTSTTFVTALSAYLGQTVWNAAGAGQSPTRSLARALQATSAGSLPPTIVLEVPNHFLVRSANLIADIAQALAEIPVPDLPVLRDGASDSDRFSIPSFSRSRSLVQGGTVEFGNQPLLLRVPWEQFVFPQDGTVVAVLRGRVVSGRLSVVVGYGEDALRMIWDADRNVIALPLAGHGFGRQLDVSVTRGAGSPAATLELESIELHADLDLDGPLLPSRPRQDTDRGWEQVSTMGQVTIVDDDCIGVVLPGTDAQQGPLEVLGRLDDGVLVPLFGPASVRHDATLLVPVRAEPGRSLESVVVRGEGSTGGDVRVFALRRLR